MLSRPWKLPKLSLTNHHIVLPDQDVAEMPMATSSQWGVAALTCLTSGGFCGCNKPFADTQVLPNLSRTYVTDMRGRVVGTLIKRQQQDPYL
jgi:hypothetical protein